MHYWLENGNQRKAAKCCQGPPAGSAPLAAATGFSGRQHVCSGGLTKAPGAGCSRGRKGGAKSDHGSVQLPGCGRHTFCRSIGLQETLETLPFLPQRSLLTLCRQATSLSTKAQKQGHVQIDSLVTLQAPLLSSCPSLFQLHCLLLTTL